MSKTEAEIAADKEFAQYIIITSTKVQDYKSIHEEFKTKTKDKKRLPIFDDKKKNQDVMKAFAAIMTAMIQFTIKKPDEIQGALEKFNKYLSYNPLLANEFTSPSGLKSLSQMKLSSIAIDFDQKSFTFASHLLSLSIFGILNRSNIS